MKNHFAVIMAGGSGTRFWPQSSKKNPKQFLNLVDKKSMLQLTFDRLKAVAPKSNISVVTVNQYASQIKKQLGSVKLIIEPEARNTMAAVCLSVWTIAEKNPQSMISLLPADAYVANTKGYQKAINDAFIFAEKNPCIVCIGIKPTYAATAYGYIEVGPVWDEGIYKISKFYEKPNLQRAEEFFSSGHFLWNAGIFVSKAETFKNEVKTHAPDFFDAFEKAFKKKGMLSQIYKKLPKIPVDTALMEKTASGAIVPGDFGWNDVGSWPAIREVMKSNSEAGLIQATGGFQSIASKNNLALLESKKFLALIGIEDLIIVETKNVLLICHKNKAEEIKNMVGLLEKNPTLKKLT